MHWRRLFDEPSRRTPQVGGGRVDELLRETLELDYGIEQREAEIQRLKAENKWYSAVVNYCVGHLPRRAFEKLLDIPRKEPLARHKAEQEVIEAVLGYRRSLNGEDSCSEEFWLQEIETAADALDAVAPHALNQEAENG